MCVCVLVSCNRRQITKYFVSLNPPPHIDRATMLQKKHSELTARIRSLEKLEDRYVPFNNIDNDYDQ